MKKISKLGNNDGVKMSSTVGGQRELIRQHRNKINSIIDSLNTLMGEDECKKTTPHCEHCEGECKQINSPKDGWVEDLRKVKEWINANFYSKDRVREIIDELMDGEEESFYGDALSDLLSQLEPKVIE